MDERRCRHDYDEYVESIFDSNGGAERDISNRVKLAWMKWKQLTGLLCEKNVPIKLKDKVYKTVIKPTMTHGAECWAIRKKDENILHVAKMRMLRWIRVTPEHTISETRSHKRMPKCAKCQHS